MFWLGNKNNVFLNIVHSQQKAWLNSIPHFSFDRAVYLKISRPTAGRGVQLKFHGYERCEYTKESTVNFIKF